MSIKVCLTLLFIGIYGCCSPRTKPSKEPIEVSTQISKLPSTFKEFCFKGHVFFYSPPEVYKPPVLLQPILHDGSSIKPWKCE